MSNFEKVAYFNSVCGNKQGDIKDPDWDAARAQIRLIAEEFCELGEGIMKLDITEVRDAIADVLVTTYGMAHRLGIDADADMDEVCKSNMSKLCITHEEVEQTLKYYADMGVAVYAPASDLPIAVRVTYTHVVGDKEYSKGKILKCVNWNEPQFK